MSYMNRDWTLQTQFCHVRTHSQNLKISDNTRCLPARCGSLNYGCDRPLCKQFNVVHITHQMIFKVNVCPPLIALIGSVNICTHDSGAIVKTLEVAEVPVHCVKFIACRNWFFAGLDDVQLWVLNYNTNI